MKIIKLNNKHSHIKLKNILDNRNTIRNEKLTLNVKNIINNVKINGDTALYKYAKKFDKISVKRNQLKLNLNYKKSNLSVDINILKSFRLAIKNITKFHKLQYPSNIIKKENNIILQSQWKAIDSVGLYVPGGKAFYPSSLIMNVVPAKIAGVKRIVCVTPPSKEINHYFLALIKELKIDEVYFVGGAQAIAALAIGTKTIKPVNKIFGPGNAFVAEAKRQLFGKVGIDLIAGPSEIVVVANKNNNPKWVASDLIAQAEHDANAQSILITDNAKFADLVLLEVKKLSQLSQKKQIIEKSLSTNGIVLIVNNINECSNVINEIAPEHLHIQIKSYKKLLSKINNAGGIFLGEYSTEAFGDYIVGTNHVLPTSGAAKFSSGLGVLDFMKRNSIVQINSKSFDKLKQDTINMSSIEGLDAHKMSVKIRQKN
tara:strand:- start:511 stop:1794 length:1284 start_codon:yes stop_codon:yes gene_type:complete